MATVPRDASAISLLALFAKFLRFGMLAFGGPVAQIALIRSVLVDEERWIDPARFNRLLAVMQVLPGPEAHELCVHMGMVARGRIGGLLAGLGFMLPGFFLMMFCGWVYSQFVGQLSGLEGALLGVQVAVLAVIARSVQRIGEHIVNGPFLFGLAALGAVGTLADLPFWVPLAAAAIAGLLATAPVAAFVVAALICAAGIFLATPVQGDAADKIAHAAATLPALFLAGLKGGLLTFGGAYTAIPYVRADTVGRGWLGDGAFLDGVALANLIPAPLVIFATFAGYIAGGPAGALAITAGMFLPAFAFSLVLFERLEGLVDHPRLHKLLDAVAAAAIGVIAATLVHLAISAAQRVDRPVAALPILLLAAIAAWGLKGKWVPPVIVAAGAVAGAALLG